VGANRRVFIGDSKNILLECTAFQQLRVAAQGEGCYSQEVATSEVAAGKQRAGSTNSSDASTYEFPDRFAQGCKRMKFLIRLVSNRNTASRLTDGFRVVDSEWMLT
jgi:hypothetical protein